MGTGLIERDGELEAIGAALARARSGRGAVVVLEGPAGIGKTALLAEASVMADRVGARVLGARASELEADLPLGLVRRLLEPLVVRASEEERRRRLAGPAALAEVVVGMAPGAAAPDAHAVRHALFWLCLHVAEEQPLVLLADDLHWADAESLAALAHLAGRVDDVALALIGATRRPDPARDGALQALLAGGDGRTVRPAGLTAAGVAQLAEKELGHELDQAELQACAEATGGRPFFVRELTRELRRRPRDRPAALADALREAGPSSIARSLLGRLALASPDSPSAARAMAVLGRDASPPRVARLAGLDEDAAVRALDALGAAGLLDERGTDFVHPVVRSAVHGDIPPAERGLLHARAARLLAGDGLGADRVAVHVRRAPPSGDPAAVATLAEAALLAVGAGAPDGAVDLLRRALAEPPAPERRGELHGLLGRALELSGQGVEAEEHLRAAIDSAEPGPEWAELQHTLVKARVKAGDFRAAAATCREALAELGVPPGGAAGEPAIAARLEGELLTAALNDAEASTAMAPHLLAVRERWDAGEDVEPDRLAPLAMFLTGMAPPAAVGGDLAASLTGPDTPLDLGSTIIGCAGNALLFAGRLAEAEEWYRRFLDHGVRTGQPYAEGWGSAFLATVLHQRGQVAEAARLSLHGLRLVLRLGRGGSVGVAWTAAHAIAPLLAQGAIDEAEEAYAAIEAAGLPPAGYPRSLALGALARLRLARGRPREAVEAALEGCAPFGMAFNPLLGPWRGLAAQAAAELGDADRARELAERELAAARSFGLGGAGGIARAVLVALDGPPAIDEALAHAAAADAADLPLEGATIRLACGAALRRARRPREAQDHLRAALAAFARCGATGLEAAARTELHAAGARPRRSAQEGPEALTAAERRVAELAAAGRTNREIAHALFVTPRTVEGHLTAIFRKLGVSARGDLSQALEPPGTRS